MGNRIIYSVIFIMAAFCLKAQPFTFTLQPGSSGMDATISSQFPTVNQGTVGTLRASRNTSGLYERSLLQFDLSALSPGIVILSAELVLSGVNHTGTGDNEGVLQMVPAAWSETLATRNKSTLPRS